MPKRPKAAKTQRPAPNWWGRIVGGGVLMIVIALCGVYLQWHYGARRLEVKLVWGRADIRGGLEHKYGLHLAAINPGHQRVRITKAGIFLPDGSPFPYSSPYIVSPSSGNWEFPCYVDPDDNRAITLDGPNLKDFCDALVSGRRTGTVTLVGFYIRGSDLEGSAPYESRPLQFNIEEGLKRARAQIEAAGSSDSGGVNNNQ